MIQRLKNGLKSNSTLQMKIQSVGLAFPLNFFWHIQSQSDSSKLVRYVQLKQFSSYTVGITFDN